MRLIETPLRELGQRDREAWRALAAPNGVLTSPYLLPEFADLIEAERGDVRVVIAEENGAPVGYFACHAPDGGVVRPVGAPLSDYQGFAARPGFAIDPDRLLETLGASALVYDNWTGPAPGRTRERAGSAVIDLSGGAERWLENRKALHKAHFKKIAQRGRKAEREFGPVRIVFGDPLGERYAALKAWKSAQYRESGLTDLFSVPWIDGALACNAARAFGPFRGLTASLYLGETLAAVETGLAAGGVYHSWFPAYDVRFKAVSPGLLLLHGIIEAAEKLGLSRIDLGKGEQAYKAYYTDYEIPLSGGRALAPGLAAARVAGWEMAESAGAVLPGPLAAAPLKLRRRWSQTASIETEFGPRLKRFAQAFAAAPRRLSA
jgi:CelD/BcsL family acetyltransferase involved in cellulose biosynthesis